MRINGHAPIYRPCVAAAGSGARHLDCPRSLFAHQRRLLDSCRSFVFSIRNAWSTNEKPFQKTVLSLRLRVAADQFHANLTGVEAQEVRSNFWFRRWWRHMRMRSVCVWRGRSTPLYQSEIDSSATLLPVVFPTFPNFCSEISALDPCWSPKYRFSPQSNACFSRQACCIVLADSPGLNGCIGALWLALSVVYRYLFTASLRPRQLHLLPP